MLTNDTIWYHGTLSAAAENIRRNGVLVNFPLSIRLKDFGLGFYLTQNYHEADLWANRQYKRMLRSVRKERGVPEVLSFRFDLIGATDNFKVKDFGDNISLQWANFVAKNRNYSYDAVLNSVPDFDVIYGLIADGIDLPELVKQFKQAKTQNARRRYMNLMKPPAKEPILDQLCINNQKVVDKYLFMLK